MSYIARHHGIDTPEQAGLRPPRSPSSPMPAGARGAAWHYIGANFSPSSHAQCRANWRNSQDHHMRPGGLGIKDGANTIGYNVGTCPHGIILLGRGWTARPIAHGSGNGTHFAVQWMLGPGDTPTTEMIEAALWATLEFRRRGAGREVRPHSSFMSTLCPGNRVRALIPSYHLREIPIEEDDMPTAKEVADEVIARLTMDVNEGSTLVTAGLFNPGRSLAPRSGLAYGWGYAKIARRGVDQALAELAGVRAELAAQRELIAALAGGGGGALTDEQVHELADRIADAGQGACNQVLARLAEAGRALVDDDDT